MIYPKKPLAQSILSICKSKAISQIIISPGSRNAPLTIGFANDDFFKTYSIADERCAAFFAMGIAQQTEQPTALVCTSGSALLNYYPAVAEAFYSQIPLIVISADRPAEKIDIGDGQTIRQRNVFENHIIFSANLTEEASAENDAKIQEAIHLSKINKGPVHINVPFEEPLYETVSQLIVTPKFVDFEDKKSTEISLENFAEQWNHAAKKLILVGVNEPKKIDQKWLELLANDPSVVVMTETTSNLHHPKFVNNIDTIITPFSDEDFKNFQPEILLTFGGMIVSKRIKAFLRKYKPAEHWHVDNLRAYNTFGALTYHFEFEPNLFLENFLPKIQFKNSDYNQNMQSLRMFRKAKHDAYLKEIPYCDFKVFDEVLSSLPTESMLQIGNSSAIRYAQLIDIHPEIEVFCNRGTSGIDGSTSTAIGASLFGKKNNFVITGDISFFYDSNALWNQYIPENFKIIVVNNGGGGIFRILPGHNETPVFNTYFETSHSLSAKHLAKMFGFQYFSVDNEIDLSSQLSAFYASGKKSILEIFTPTTVNDKVLLQYFKALS
ncbi:2-succinyl-5-enolpyruvyl-6-hydroxy-3-cyclohexene-1-carboxylic-acid synthase [Flavobacterium sp. NST-5]|uniref:2-succinyl-5-enolpyruvyl-6-hydroxy-3-cyclohexene-1-carboxylate synthase n=1 Tax=Flavobacterium ichthyis TaxID=2698827 RepID=A0ABW9Z6M5_9FLAO|nr:2-succinyl-5-enolpyruvyl-6-hydroxy-3-cyclohexene-1-carboxylic-acid synthase [Flavobacterium ichthyis]NBL64314.1 2-succinyl-5-enolpyruvyl-6-hydroxy-3-cyclohexene-1-carboxylic-acid synthase [Flavobacterium ichthyis]